MDENPNNKSNQGPHYHQLPKTFANINNWIFMIIFTVIGFGVIGFAMYDYSKSQSIKNFIYLLLLACIFFVITVVVFIANRRLGQKSRDNLSANLGNKFSSGTSVTLEKSFDSANITDGEKILDWVGPATRYGKGAGFINILDKETDLSPENTLLFTDHQIIAIMVGPDDINKVKNQNGFIKNIASSVVDISTETHQEKNIQNVILYLKQWPEIMGNLLSLPLNQLLESHFNFGVPNDLIESVFVKNGILNPGFVFKLKDGRELSYAVQNKDKMDEAATFLGAKFNVTK